MFTPELWQSHDEYRTIVKSLGNVLPNSIFLTYLCGFSSVEDLPPLGSYYDLMDRLWLASREQYARSALLPAGKNGKKPAKTIGDDGKLAEDPSHIFSARHTVDLICKGSPASGNPEAALQEIFSLLAFLPSIRLGLIGLDDLTVSGDGTAVVSHTSPNGRHLSS